MVGIETLFNFHPFEINYFRFACICFKFKGGGEKKNKGASSFIVGTEFKLAHGALQGFND